ncbi:MAG: tRNA guanosine(34) transglycosylase Tgt [Planctomycetota bacterium]|nr:tRNA guanosine(34) transglycosylase Tgt [Planctomycetota bacterium]
MLVAPQGGAGPRAGILRTSRGEVPTPAFMPVGTRGAVKGLTVGCLREMGASIILANAYHLAMRPGEKLIAGLGGLHRFCGWNGPILTDSGGYQVFSLAASRRISEEGVEFRSPVDGSVRFFSPEGVIGIQAMLGSDIVMPLDICPPGDAPPAEVEEAVERTLRWAERSVRAAAGTLAAGQALFAIVQGGTDERLRRRSAEASMAIGGFGGFAIGGLSVGEDPARTMETVRLTAPMLPADLPRYLMGMGRPGDIVRAIGFGADMFDCVLPTRNARNAQAFTSRGTIRLRSAAFAADGSPIDPDCDCETCRHHSRAFIRHLFLAGDMNAAILTTIHNVSFYLRLVRDARAAILEGRFEAFRDGFLARLPEGGTPGAR